MNSLVPPALALDDASVDPGSLSLSALTRELRLAQRPPRLLTRFMTALEQRRQVRGLGWSRPWNKTGVTIFRAHRLFPLKDADYFTPLLGLLDAGLVSAPPSYRNFTAELMTDPQRMSFTFYHNRTAEAGRQFEGLTISLGRKATGNPSKRDRLDVILEDERAHGRVDGTVDRLRIYVCPWRTYQNRQEFHGVEDRELEGGRRLLAQNLYDVAVARYHEWKGDAARQWNHWSASFIEHFGPRSFIPQNSSFT